MVPRVNLFLLTQRSRAGNPMPGRGSRQRLSEFIIGRGMNQIAVIKSIFHRHQELSVADAFAARLG